MRTTFLAVIVMAVAAQGAAATTDFPAGNVFYVHRGSSLAHSSMTQAVELRPGGEWRGLFVLQWPSMGRPQQLGSAGEGTWTYESTGSATARVVLKYSDGAFADEVYLLQFTSQSEGTLDLRETPETGTFRLAPVSPPSSLANSSNRSWVRPDTAAFAGFVIAGSSSRVVLIRAVGPGLRRFGVVDCLAHPAVQVTRLGVQGVLGANVEWSAVEQMGEAITRTGALVGAFPLEAGSADSALILSLPPGPYVAEVTAGVAGEGGQVLLETYILP
jgi:hypothetical protein